MTSKRSNDVLQGGFYLILVSYYSSVTDMLNFLEWPTLQERRRVNRLSQFHKIVHQLTPSVQLPSYFLPTQYPTRQLHQHRFIIPASSTMMYQKSFFPNTLRQSKRMELLTQQYHRRTINAVIHQPPLISPNNN